MLPLCIKGLRLIPWFNVTESKLYQNASMNLYDNVNWFSMLPYNEFIIRTESEFSKWAKYTEFKNLNAFPRQISGFLDLISSGFHT